MSKYQINSLILAFYFLLIIISKPRLVLFESISFLKTPFLNKPSMVIIDSKKRDVIENIRIIKLLVIELFLSNNDFLDKSFFMLIRTVMC